MHIIPMNIIIFTATSSQDNNSTRTTEKDEPQAKKDGFLVPILIDHHCQLDQSIIYQMYSGVESIWQEKQRKAAKMFNNWFSWFKPNSRRI